MRLLAWMRENEVDDDAMAARIGDCSGFAVKKWKYAEREPDASTIVRIEAVTEGKVALADWAAQAAERSEKDGRRAAAAETRAVA